MDYNIGLGYQTGTLLTKNSIKVAFLNGKPKQEFKNNNIVLQLGPKLKKELPRIPILQVNIGLAVPYTAVATLRHQ